MGGLAEDMDVLFAAKSPPQPPDKLLSCLCLKISSDSELANFHILLPQRDLERRLWPHHWNKTHDFEAAPFCSEEEPLGGKGSIRTEHDAQPMMERTSVDHPAELGPSQLPCHVEPTRLLRRPNLGRG